MNNTEKSFLTEKVVELISVVSGIQVSVKHLEDTNAKILTQTTLTNGRVTSLEKFNSTELISDVKDLKEQVSQIHKTNHAQDVAIGARDGLKSKWRSTAILMVQIIGGIFSAIGFFATWYLIYKSLLPPDTGL